MSSDDLTPEQRERVEAAVEVLVQVSRRVWAVGSREEMIAYNDTFAAANDHILATVAALVSEAVAAERGRWEDLVADVGQMLGRRAHALRWSAPPIDLASVQDPNFCGGLDPVTYLDRLREGMLEIDHTYPAAHFVQAGDPPEPVETTLTTTEPEGSPEWVEVSRKAGRAGRSNGTIDPARPHPHTEEPQ